MSKEYFESIMRGLKEVKAHMDKETEFKVDYFCTKCRMKVNPKWVVNEKRVNVGYCPNARCGQEVARKASFK